VITRNTHKKQRSSRQFLDRHGDNHNFSNTTIWNFIFGSGDAHEFDLSHKSHKSASEHICWDFVQEIVAIRTTETKKVFFVSKGCVKNSRYPCFLHYQRSFVTRKKIFSPMFRHKFGNTSKKDRRKCRQIFPPLKLLSVSSNNNASKN
jgi:hypothetical protein